jgi:hypothetical protein
VQEAARFREGKFAVVAKQVVTANDLSKKLTDP